MNKNSNKLGDEGIETETALALQNLAGSVGGNDLLFTRRSKGALRSDKNEGKAKVQCFLSAYFAESLQQNRGEEALDFGVFSLVRFFGQTKK